MRQESSFEGRQSIRNGSLLSGSFLAGPASQSFLSRPFTKPEILFSDLPQHTLIGFLLLAALLAFEIFNFDAIQFALSDFWGDMSFLGLKWATILAITFCAIDFAGLAYLVGLDRAREQHNEVWYLMGAWLLGATMNALMTWWAVTVTLMRHDLGIGLLGREDQLLFIPILVAAMVWLTRILFIGTFSIAGSRLFGANSDTGHNAWLSSTDAASHRQPLSADFSLARDITSPPSHQFR